MGWATADIGNIGDVGTSTDSNNVFRLTGSGERMVVLRMGFTLYIETCLPMAELSHGLRMLQDETSSKGFVMIREDLTQVDKGCHGFLSGWQCFLKRRLTANTNS
ncbi:MAG: hypothetical protein R3B93_16180 [Bacteroidia bacterium]